MNERQSELERFSSGSVRSSRAGRGRFDLLPPEGLAALAKRYEMGAVLYGERNWELGQFVSRNFDSLMRHAVQWAAGDNSEDHMAAVAWNALAIITFRERIKSGRMSSVYWDMGPPLEDGNGHATNVMADGPQMVEDDVHESSPAGVRVRAGRRVIHD